MIVPLVIVIAALVVMGIARLLRKPMGFDEAADRGVGYMGAGCIGFFKIGLVLCIVLALVGWLFLGWWR